MSPLLLGTVALAAALAAPADAHAVPGPELREATAAQVLEEVRRPGARAIVVNVWATWCLPCREEFPDLVRLWRSYHERGLRLVLVAADFDDDRAPRVRAFLDEHGVSFPSFLKHGNDDAQFIEGLEPSWSGALPVTLLFDGDGRRRGLWEGLTSFSTLEASVLELLGPAPSASTNKEGS